jgi:hypothetical protein
MSSRLPKIVCKRCLQEVWPDFDTSCLRNSETGAMIRQARLVIARH